MVLVLKIRLLLWKNFLLRRRNKFRFIAELVYPLLLFVPLLVNKPASLPVHTPECHYMDIALPSSGQLPFLHSLINDTRNSCHGPKQTQTHEQRKTRGKKYRHKTVDAHEPQACQEIKDFITKDGGAMKWDLLKPYLRGKVMYYPDTDTTRAIMMGVNETLNKISAPVHLEDDAMQVLRSALGNEVIDFISGLVSDGSLSDPGLTTENRTAAGAFSTKNSRQPGPKVLRDFYALLEECVDTQKVQAVDPENALQIAWALQETNNLWALIVFEDADKPLLKYSIRMGADRLPGPERFISDHLSAGSDASSLQRNKFISHGFLYLQDIIDEAVIAQRTNRTNCPGRIIRRFPSPATSTDNLRNLTAQLVPMMAALAWMYTFSQAVKSAVLEKEGRIKEVLAAMGLGRGVQWAGWMLEGLCCTLCTCTLLAVILKLGGVTEHSDVLVVLLLLASHAVAMLSLALLLASLFSRAVVAGPAAGIVYFLTYLAYQLVRSQAGEGRWAMLGGLVSTVALAQGAAVISAAEERGEGAQWTNIHVPLGPREPCTVAACVALLWVDAALYALLTWYIDAVFPGEYGVPKGYLFFLSKSYWLGIPTAGECDVLRATVRNRRESISGTTESEPQGAVIGVAIDNLSKVFGKDVAVDGLTLNLCQNQITCLLGHNGSGKTTVLSVLMGLYTPSAGTAYVNGLDIRTDMDLIRTGMGVCPQHNMLFNSLTVEEHLLFFGRIKAVPEPILRAEIDEMLNMMGLQHKRGAFPGALSGGMQRKLSVAMAFSGRSSVVLLDEPTAGVDPCSRRGIWDLLARLRIGRTIILTTHFMDEADLLGDRVVILRGGRLQCSGSGVFLKRRLGSGYLLDIELLQGSMSGHGKALLHREVLTLVPTAQLRRETSREVQYALPNRHDVGSITTLLNRLDEQPGVFGTTSYAISDTGLEEIFFKVSKAKVSVDEPDAALVYGEPRVQHLTGRQLVVSQLVALTRKRLQHARRDVRGLFVQLVLPAIFVALALGQTTTSPQSLQVRPDQLGSPIFSFVELQKGGGPWADRFVLSLLQNGVSSSAPRAHEGLPDVSLRPQVLHELGSVDSCANVPPSTTSALLKLPTGELFFNASGTDVEHWITSTYRECQSTRFGGVTFGARYQYSETVYSAQDGIRVWFDGSPGRDLSAPAYLNAVTNVVLRTLLPFELPAGHHRKDYGIQTSSWPLPENPDEDSGRAEVYETNVIVASSVTVVLAMTLVPAWFASSLVEERVSQAKHLHLVSGLGPCVYWLHSLFCDVVCYTVSAALVVLVFAAYHAPMYTAGTNIIILGLLLFLYGTSTIPLLYLCSWCFRIPTAAFLVMSSVNMTISTITIVTIVIAKMVSPAAVNLIDLVFRILPQYCVGQGIMNMSIVHFSNRVKRAMGEQTTPPLAWEVTGKFLAAMALASVVLTGGVLLAEQSTHWWHGWRQHAGPGDGGDLAGRQDGDVLLEEDRVLNGGADNGMLVLRRLTKRYNKLAAPAVNAVSLGVERGECFGLLGLNGAGKTTIFKMLTGDTLISGGDAQVAGRSVRADMDSARRVTGYCPQFDALVPLLTVREHLELYSGLRGVPASARAHTVRRCIDLLGLGALEKSQARHLFGGNKRKLSVAIALVGDPLLVYMDEPTTSMDPGARRQVWRLVHGVVAAGRSVLLTSHSMDECEVLCQRLTVMANGRMTCLGSPHHLKRKHGAGYTAVVCCQASRTEEVVSYLLERLSGGALVESHLHQLKFHWPPEVSLVRLFLTLDEARVNGIVCDYSVSHTTLEDVFMKFASDQEGVLT